MALLPPWESPVSLTPVTTSPTAHSAKKTLFPT